MILLTGSVTLAVFLVVAYFLLSLVVDVGGWVAARAARLLPSQQANNSSEPQEGH